MLKRLSIVLILAALAGGVAAGMPLPVPKGKMMKCCDKAKNKANNSMSRSASLCCAINCSEPVPTSPGGFSNFAPVNFTISKSIAEQIAALFTGKNAVPTTDFRYDREIILRTFQPKFIQHNSFLI